MDILKEQVNKKAVLNVLLIFLVAVSSASMLHAQRNHIVVSKRNFTLCIINSKSDTVAIFPCGVGKRIGNKKKRGDNKTPEGVFSIISIENSTKWTHDFNDGKGERKGAYGPWFIRLKIPKFRSIGIHGTCFPKSIGTRCSEGCIRLRNEDLVKVKKYVYVGMKCIIEND